MDTSTVSERRGRKPGKTAVHFKCSVCEYTSERYYNVARHEFRIHTPAAKKRRCCDEYFLTKGDYYLHCEERHPQSRAASIVSRTKYKILPGTRMVNALGFSCSTAIRDAPYAFRERASANVRAPWKTRRIIEDTKFVWDLEISNDVEYINESTNSSHLSSEYGRKNSSLDINRNELIADTRKNIRESPSIDHFSKEPLNKNITHDSRVREIFTHSDESRENSVRSAITNFRDLPIKKRILRDVTNFFDSSCSRATNENSTCVPEPREKSRYALKKIKSCDRTNNDENLASRPSNVREHDDRTPRTIHEKLDVQVDPRISSNDFTLLHREYFDSMLCDRSLLERFRG